MCDQFESDDRTRGEIINSLYRSLIYDWDIPEHICDHYGLTEDYQLYHQINAMDPDEYRQKKLEGILPDVLEIDARLTRRAEDIFERLCPHPPASYLDQRNMELERLRLMVLLPNYMNDLIHIRPDFLAKYGINKDSPEDIRRKQVEKAYRELDARIVKMTGRLPYADELFRRAKTGQPASSEAVPRKGPHIKVCPKPKGRKMGL